MVRGEKEHFSPGDGGGELSAGARGGARVGGPEGMVRWREGTWTGAATLAWSGASVT